MRTPECGYRHPDERPAAAGEGVPMDILHGRRPRPPRPAGRAAAVAAVVLPVVLAGVLGSAAGCGPGGSDGPSDGSSGGGSGNDEAAIDKILAAAPVAPASE